MLDLEDSTDTGGFAKRQRRIQSLILAILLLESISHVDSLTSDALVICNLCCWYSSQSDFLIYQHTIKIPKRLFYCSHKLCLKSYLFQEIQNVFQCVFIINVFFIKKVDNTITT